MSTWTVLPFHSLHQAWINVRGGGRDAASAVNMAQTSPVRAANAGPDGTSMAATAPTVAVTAAATRPAT
jgi:hypothetical protein